MARDNGSDEMVNKIRKLAGFAPDEFARALYQESEVERKECQRSTPVKTGALRGSIHVEGPFRDGRRVWCMIVAGDASTPYALIVHEDLEAFHGNGEAKYIERPLNESAPYMAERITARVDLNKAL